jgi:thiosulfate dehydrogenase
VPSTNKGNFLRIAVIRAKAIGLAPTFVVVRTSLRADRSSYIRYISQALPVGEPTPGRGIPALPLPEKASDPRRGAEVFQTQCAMCHQPDGQGKRLDAVEAAQERRRFEFPPLWGPKSYNDGAGMARNITAADFIRANMPFGTDSEHPVGQLQRS